MTFPLRRALPHRLVVAAAVALLAAATLVQAQDGKANRYTLQVAVNIADGGQYVFDITVRDGVTNEVVAHPKVQTPAGVPAEITTDGTPVLKIRALGEKNGHAEVSMKALDGGGNVIDAVAAALTVEKSKAQAITLHLKDADLKDVIRVFGQLTNLETKIDPDVDGRITVNFDDVPWDQALQKILFDNHCEYELQGKTVHVRRMW